MVVLSQYCQCAHSSYVGLWAHYIIYIKFYILFFFVMTFWSLLPTQEEPTEVVPIEKTIYLQVCLLELSLVDFNDLKV